MNTNPLPARSSVVRKLGASFLAVLACSVGLGVFSIFQLARVNETSKELQLNWLPSVRATSDMNTNTANFRVAELQHVLSNDETQKARYEKDMADVTAAFDKDSAEYVKLVSSPEEQSIYDGFKKNWSEYLGEHTKLMALSRTNKVEEAKALARGESQKQFDEASADLLKLVDLNVKGGNDASSASAAIYSASRWAILAFVVLSVGVGVAAFWWVTRSLMRQLGGEPDYAAQIAHEIAAGNLSSDIHLRGGDTTSLVAAMKTMRDGLASIVGQVRQSSDSIATGSAEIATGNADLSQRTEEQASNLQQTAASMEELTSTVRQNSDTARQANQLASSASQAATQGGVVVSQVVGTMEEITASSRKIADIISVIDGIAFQTNILALNAAVEAARAGEQGRGFAVVAGEVRNLAQRSAEAAKEIKGLIGQSVEKVEAGSRLVDDAGKSMADIVVQVKRVNDLIAEISSASIEQSSGIAQVGDAVAQLDQVTQQNAALVEQSAAAADSLKQQAANLAEVVSVFRLGHEGSPHSPDRPAAQERRSPNRATNVTRPKFGPKTSTAAATPRAPAAPAAAKTGTDDWESF